MSSPSAQLDTFTIPALKNIAEADLLKHLHRIRCPALIATGEHDSGSTPEMARRMHERIAGSQRVILPRYRHGLLVEAAADVAGLLCDFLVESVTSGSSVPSEPAP